MLARIALLISTLAAAWVLAIGISMATGSAMADTGLQATPDTVSLVDGTFKTPRVQVDTVYVPAPIAPQTITVHRNVTLAGSGDDEDEVEGGEE
jgi:hypothetical protein